MNKLDSLNRFQKYYSQLTDTKRNDFSRLINKLLNENFIYFHLDSDKQDYYNVLELRELIEDYFNLMDFELIQDDNNKIFFLKTTADRNRVRLKKLETVIILLLRRIYDQNLSQISSSSNITTSLKEIYDALRETGIYKDMPKRTVFIDALKTLKKYKIINFTNLDDEDNLILIYPTLVHVVKINDVTMLKNKIESYKLTKEENSDEDN